MENAMCAAFKEYEDMPEMVPLDFTEDDVTWVALNIYGAVGALGVEANEMRNWLICFGFASEKLRVVVSRMDEWMDNYSPTWAVYYAIMVCHLLALDKMPRVHPVRVGKTLRRDLAKLIMRAAGDQAKIACGNLKLCPGLEDSIEGTTYSVGKRQIKMMVRISRVEELAVHRRR